MISEYRKRPGLVKAIQWTGDNIEEIRSFLKHTQVSADLLARSIIFTNTHTGRTDSMTRDDLVFIDDFGNVVTCSDDNFIKVFEKVDTPDYGRML